MDKDIPRNVMVSYVLTRGTIYNLINHVHYLVRLRGVAVVLARLLVHQILCREHGLGLNVRTALASTEITITMFSNLGARVD